MIKFKLPLVFHDQTGRECYFVIVAASLGHNLEHYNRIKQHEMMIHN